MGLILGAMAGRGNTDIKAEEDWDSRNLLYSLRFNITAGVLIPGSNYREK